MKTAFKIIGGLVVVLAVILVILYLNLDRGIKAAVEELGPRFTGSDVTLDRVSVSPFSGKGSMSGLVVTNPPGFKSPAAFTLKNIDIALDTGSLTGDVIVIDQLHISDPEVTYELGRSGSNLKALKNNVKRAASPGSNQSGQGKGSKKLVIRDFSLTGGRVHYSNPLLGNQTADVTMPDMHLTGIGEKSGGATVAEVVQQLVTLINLQAARAIASSDVVDKLHGKVDEQVEKQKGKLEDTLKGLKDRLGQ